jgi:hypothetical protein
MIIPRKSFHRPRMTLGQILASVAVSTLPIAMIMRALRTTESAVDIAIAAFFCLCATVLFEAFFWGFLIHLCPPLHRALGQPSWFLWVIEANPEGISWVEDRSDPARSASDEGIRWEE